MPARTRTVKLPDVAPKTEREARADLNALVKAARQEYTRTVTMAREQREIAIADAYRLYLEAMFRH